MRQRILALFILAWALFLPFVWQKSCNHNLVQAQIVSTPEQTSPEFLDVEYGPHTGHGGHLLDLRLPSIGQPPYPLIIYIHGGGWSSGDKWPFPSTLLLTHGYATASINYRLSGVAKFPAQIEDCKMAVSWLRSHAPALNLDPNHIGVWGSSAGGHLAALLGTTGDALQPRWAAPLGKISNHVDAVCDWCGPSDLISMLKETGMKDRTQNFVTHFLGAPVWVRPDLAKQASPVTYVHKGCPPFLIMHGDQDPLIPIAQSKELSDRLKASGVNCTLITVAGGHHNFYTEDNERKVLEFFDRALRNK